MRKGSIGLVTAMALAWTMASVGCSSSDSTPAGTGGSSGSSGGTGGTSGSSGAGGGAGGSGGGSDSGAPSVTTLSGTKGINTLTATEATQLCNDTFAYFRSAIPKAVACKWKGLLFGAQSSAPTVAMTRANCTNRESSCQQSADPWPNDFGCDLPKPSCMATVAEYSACIGDEVAAFMQIVNGLPSCNMLMSGGTVLEAQSNAQNNPPARCASLADKCPDLTPNNPLTQ